MFRSKINGGVFLGIGLALLLSILGVGVDRGGMVGMFRPVRTSLRDTNTKTSSRQILRQIYTSQIGVREKSGRNDGTEVEKYLNYTGLSRGNAWCAAFVSWTFYEAGLSRPKTAWSPALFPDNRLTNHPQTGDVFGIYFQELKRIGHCGFVDEWSGIWCVTVEGNTNDVNSVASTHNNSNPIRAGPADGVCRKKRLIKTIYKVADWISASK